MTGSSKLSVISSNTRQRYFANLFSSQVNQSLSDSWHSRIGSAAISIVNAFLESEKRASSFTTDDSRQEFAKTMLEDFRFLYSDTESSNPKASLPLQNTVACNIYGFSRSGRVSFGARSLFKRLVLTSSLLPGQSRSRPMAIQKRLDNCRMALFPYQQRR
jgi:hypothetical protein